MRDVALSEAQAQREALLADERLDAFLDKQLDVLLSEADTVSPAAREKLRGILKHYAKEAHPFRACVRDNMKRFGPGRTERVCAVLKDIIRGTTRWRGHEDVAASAPALDAETEVLLLSIPDDKLDALILQAQEVA